MPSNAQIAMNIPVKERRLSVGKDRRRSLGEEPTTIPKPPQRRKSDTLEGVLKRIDVVEQCLIEHEETHAVCMRHSIEEFLADEACIGIVKRLLQHHEIKEALLAAKNQMVGEIVSAIFGNRMLWLFAGMVILLLLGYDMQSVKDLIRAMVT